MYETLGVISLEYVFIIQMTMQVRYVLLTESEQGVTRWWITPADSAPNPLYQQVFINANANVCKQQITSHPQLCHVYGFEYPIILEYSSISSLVNLSCPFQLAELLRGRNVL
jgi:hypothetical protein